MRSTPPARSMCTASANVPRRTASTNRGGMMWKWTSMAFTALIQDQPFRAPPADQRHDLPRRRLRELRARVPGGAAVVRGQDDVVHLEELLARRHFRRPRRLVPEDIQPGAGDGAVLERPDERRFVDDPSAGRIDEVRRRLHEGELALPDHLVRAGIVVVLETHEIAAPQDRALVRPFPADLALLRGRQPGALRVEDRHPERAE